MAGQTHGEWQDEVTRKQALAAEREQPTQVAHPWHAVARTFVAIVLPALVLLPTVLPVVEAWAAEQDWVADPVRAAISAVTTIVVAVAVLITRILAVPGVNDFLTRWVPFLAAGR